MAKSTLAPHEDMMTLDAQAMIALLQYVDSTQTLPITSEGIIQELSVPDSVVAEFQDTIDNIAGVYDSIRIHSVIFEYNIYPTTMDLVDDLIKYANEAGPNYQDMYKCLTTIEMVSQEHDSHENRLEISSQKKEFNDMVNKQVASIDGMKTLAEGVVAFLNLYESASSSDAYKLGLEEKALNAKLSELDSSIENFLFWWLPNMLQHVQTFSTGLQSLINNCTSTLQDVRLMQGGFGAISDDLSDIQRQVDENIRYVKAIIADIEIDNVLESWKDLGARAETYKRIVSAQASK